MLSVSAKQHSDTQKGSPPLPSWQPALGACPFQAVPTLRIALVAVAKRRVHPLCAPAPAEELYEKWGHPVTGAYLDIF